MAPCKAWSVLILSLLAAVAFGSEPVAYRVEMRNGEPIWAEDRPQDTGALIVFHRSPGNVLVSVRKSDVRRIVAGKRPAPLHRLEPGAEIIVGATGGSSGGPPVPRGAASRSGARGPLAPGEARGGTALFNPERPYRSDWDSRQVPGANLGYPNSANDYREGRTFARPPASAVQTAPGAPPTMPQTSGEVPK
jgi:hypothetical protein